MRDGAELTFRVGFASIFLINAIVAWVSPQDFAKLVADTPFIGAQLAAIPGVVVAIGANDFVLGLLVLGGRWRRVVYVWASLWFLAITLVKVFHLVAGLLPS